MKIDFLTPSQLQYPGAQIAACQQATSVVVGGAFQPAPRDGLFNSIFTPDDLPYPLPLIQESANNGAGSQSQSVPNSGSTPSAGAGNAPAGAAPAAPSSLPAPSSAGDAPNAGAASSDHHQCVGACARRTGSGAGRRNLDARPNGERRSSAGRRSCASARDGDADCQRADRGRAAGRG